MPSRLKQTMSVWWTFTQTSPFCQDTWRMELSWCVAQRWRKWTFQSRHTQPWDWREYGRLARAWDRNYSVCFLQRFAFDCVKRERHQRLQKGHVQSTRILCRNWGRSTVYPWRKWNLPLRVKKDKFYRFQLSRRCCSACSHSVLRRYP